MFLADVICEQPLSGGEDEGKDELLKVLEEVSNVLQGFQMRDMVYTLSNYQCFLEGWACGVGFMENKQMLI